MRTAVLVSLAVVCTIPVIAQPPKTGQGPTTRPIASADQVRVFKGHVNQIYAVAFCPDGKRLVSSALDVRVWDVMSGKQLLRFGKGHGTVPALDVSPDGRLAASGHADRKIRLWDLSDGGLVRTLGGHEEWVSSLCFLPGSDQLLSSSEDATLRVWDVRKGRQVKVLQGHAGTVQGVACSPDGRYALSGSSSARGPVLTGDKSVRLWDLGKGKEVCVLWDARKLGGVFAVDFSDDGRLAAAGTVGGHLQIWRFGTRDLVKRWDTGMTVLGLRFLCGSRRIVSAGAAPPPGRPGERRTVRIWDVPTGSLVCEFRADPYGTQVAVPSPDGQYLATGGTDKVVRLWRLPAEVGSGNDTERKESSQGAPTTRAASPAQTPHR